MFINLPFVHLPFLESEFYEDRDSLPCSPYLLNEGLDEQIIEQMGKYEKFKKYKEIWARIWAMLGRDNL